MLDAISLDKDGLVVYCEVFVTRLKNVCSECWFCGVGGIVVWISVSGALNLSCFLGLGCVVVVALGSCCAC